MNVSPPSMTPVQRSSSIPSPPIGNAKGLPPPHLPAGTQGKDPANTGSPNTAPKSNTPLPAHPYTQHSPGFPQNQPILVPPCPGPMPSLYVQTLIPFSPRGLHASQTIPLQNLGLCPHYLLPLTSLPCSDTPGTSIPCYTSPQSPTACI